MFVRRVPTSQPASLTRPNYGSRLLVGATGLWSFRGPAAVNQINGEYTAASGAGATFGVGRRGRVATLTAGANTHRLASDATRLLGTTQGFTFALHYRKTDATARVSAGFGLLDGGNINVRAGAHLPWSDGSVYFDYGGNSTGTTRVIATTPTFGDDWWVFTVGARGMEIWQNGVKLASNAATPSRTASSAAYFLGTHGTGTDADNAESMGAVILPRQWSTEEIREFYRNPFQLWAPTARPRYAAAVANTITLTRATFAALPKPGSPMATLAAVKATLSSLGKPLALVSTLRAVVGTLGITGRTASLVGTLRATAATFTGWLPKPITVANAAANMIELVKAALTTLPKALSLAQTLLLNAASFVIRGRTIPSLTGVVIVITEKWWGMVRTLTRPHSRNHDTPPEG